MLLVVVVVLDDGCVAEARGLANCNCNCSCSCSCSCVPLLLPLPFGCRGVKRADTRERQGPRGEGGARRLLL